MSAETSTPTQGATPEQIAAAAAAEARLQQLLAQGDVNQANAATGLYGDSGVGKSSLCASAAEYCWKHFHRVTDYVAADLGGFGNKLLRLIRLGIVRVYNPQNHIEPFETMEDLSLGYWPETVLDPYTGFADANVKLVAPQHTEYRVYCPQNHLAATLTNKSSLQGYSRACDTCKTLVNPSNWNRVEEVTLRAAHHQHVGLRIFDSATALQDWAMVDMASRAARNMETLGGDKDGNALTKTGGRVISGRYSFGANSVAHYGFAQNRMPSWIRNARGIPGMVMPPIFTFLELRATDDTGRGAMPIYGPKIAGSAKTSDVPAWLGNCLHISREENDKGQMEHRIWTVNHIDKGGIAPHLAKTRAEPGSLPSYLADQPDEPAFTRFSLGYFFEKLDEVLYAGSQQDAVDFPDAPVFVPLPVGQETVLSQRAVSHNTVRTGAGVRTGAPTAMPAARVVPSVAVAPATPKPAAPVVAAAPAKIQAAAPVPVTTPTPPVAVPVAAQPTQPPAGAPIRPPQPPAVRPPVVGQRSAAPPPPPGAPKKL